MSCKSLVREISLVMHKWKDIMSHVLRFKSLKLLKKKGKTPQKNGQIKNRTHDLGSNK